MKAPYTAEHFLISCDLIGEPDVVRPFTGGVDLATIETEEKEIGLPITGSYLEFIKRYGSQEDEGFVGIDIKWGTLLSKRCKRFWERGMPRSHVLVYFAGTTCYSMNTEEPTAPGEFKVYEFRYGKPSVHSFEVAAHSFAELWIGYFEIEKEVDQAYMKMHPKK